MSTPILYSFRRCPYAIRARLALLHCGAQYLHREVLLKEKPVQMLQVSGKGTVPVLVLPSGCKEATANDDKPSCHVIDESIDIMHWAMNENPSRHLHNAQQWLTIENMNIDEINALINQNDLEFKSHLDQYKYSDRHPEHPQSYYFEQALPYLEKLEHILTHSRYLGGNQFRFPDAAIIPFIRQFSMVEPKRFHSLDLPYLQAWLANGLQSELFINVMFKTAPWHPDSDDGLLVVGQ